MKDLVECGPADWTVLAGLPAAPTYLIDADIATVSGAADKVLRVESVPPYLLHLEFLSGHDAAAQPRQFHKRNLLLEDRHDLTVRTVAVILRPEADSPALSGLRQRAHPGETEPYTLFRYEVLRVWQLPPDRLLQGGPGTLPLAPISAVTEAQLPGIIKRMKRRLGSRRRHPGIATIWAATYILMGLRYSAAVAKQLLHGVVSMKESTTYQEILREGWQEGRQEGRQEGSLAEAKRLVLLLGENCFGPPDSRTKAAVDRIDDLIRLEEMTLRVLKVESWADLLNPPAPRRRNGTRRSKQGRSESRPE